MSQLKTMLKFLRDLKGNNSKEWMQEQKPRYLEQKQSFHDLVQDVIDGISTFDSQVVGLEPKDCVFRINRDIRFSKDKTLYKTHFGAYMANGGRKSMLPGYYLHLEPSGKSILAAGLYRPPSKLLSKVRQEIDYNGKELTAIVEKKSWQKQFGSLRGERLIKAPKGYSLDHQYISYLQLKSYLAVLPLDDSAVTSSEFSKRVVREFGKMHPLVDFLSTAIT
jgi:uncharacterized protein (TIGR02453 family)